MSTDTIDADRLYLRILSERDCSPRYVGWLNDAQVSRFLETRFSPPQTIESVAAFVRAVAARPNEFLYGIFLREGDRHIGNIKVGPVSGVHHCGDISLLIGERDAWGRGYATEAIAALSRHAFDTMGVKKLSASFYEENVGSRKAFLKSGYVEEGRRRKHYELDGERSDIILLGLLREDLR